jgi:hypothetical protein
MRILRTCALAMVLAAFAGAAGRPAAEGSGAFMLAMLRRDGVLVPFAAYDGKQWSASWPVPKYALEAPLRFADIPARWWGRVAPATTWTAWPTRGEPHAVHVSGPIVFIAHCLSNVGLRSDYLSPEPIPPLTQQHHPKDGVATTGDVTVEPVDVLDDTAPEWAAILAQVTPAVEKAEVKGAGDYVDVGRQSWQARRARAPLKLEVLCRTKDASKGASVYYFEAVRQFAPQPGIPPLFPQPGQRGPVRRDCAFVIFSQGFVVSDGKALVSASAVSTFAACDREAVEYGLPLGTITVGGRAHWIMHWSGYGREHYTIIEIGDKSFKKVLDVPGGGC